MHRDTNVRSIAKAFSWRMFGTLTTAIIVYIFTKRLNVALFVGVVELVGKILLFWLHERLWERIPLGKHEPTPTVLWFTGLSGSGKSTIAQLGARRAGTPRASTSSTSTATRSAISSRRPASPGASATSTSGASGILASRLEEHGVTVVASFVSPYRSRASSCAVCAGTSSRSTSSTPLEECERRDVKGLYARAPPRRDPELHRHRRPVRGAGERRSCHRSTRARCTVEDAGAQVMKRIAGMCRLRIGSE